MTNHLTLVVDNTTPRPLAKLLLKKLLDRIDAMGLNATAKDLERYAEWELDLATILRFERPSYENALSAKHDSK